MKRKRRQTIVIGMVLGIAAALGGYAVLQKPEQALPECLVPVVEAPAPVPVAPAAAETKSQSVLGSAQTSYEGGSAGRGKNIELGAARIDGTVIEPQEEFSFIEALGPISQADGFEVERVFRNGEVTLGVGGGLCQVSTTLFQSVLSAGLPVTERKSHTYAVSFYKPGLDATVSNPHPDLRFVNDTQYPVTIRATAKDGVVAFELLGIPDGRKVSVGEAVISRTTSLPPVKYVRDPSLISGEVCQNSSQRGYRAQVTYRIEYPDKEPLEQVFVSQYLPLQRVCRVPE